MRSGGRRSCVGIRERRVAFTTSLPVVAASSAIAARELVLARAAVKRRDHRLDEADGAVERARITPLFEHVRLRDVPGAELRGLVEVGGQTYGRRDLGELGREAEIRRCVERRVAAEHEERVNLVRVDVRRELLDIGRLVDLGDVGGGVQMDRRADVAERRVGRVGERMNARRLAGSDDDDRATLVRDDLLGDRRDPHRGDAGGDRRVGEGRGEGAEVDGALGRELLAEREEVALDVTCRETQAMVGVATGRREVRLDDVEAAHAVARLMDLATDGERARVAQHAGFGLEEIAVERQDGLRLREVVDHVDRLAERDPRAFAHVRLVDRGVRVEARVRELRFDRVAEAEERRADARRDEEAHLRAGVAGRLLQRVREEPGPLVLRRLGALVAVLAADVADAIRIVEIEDRGLRAEIRLAAVRRVIRVAFELGRAVLVHLGEDADDFAALHPRGRVVVGNSGRRVLDLLRVRDELLDRTTAAFERREGDTAAGELEQAAAIDLPGRLGLPLRAGIEHRIGDVGHRRPRSSARPCLRASAGTPRSRLHARSRGSPCSRGSSRTSSRCRRPWPRSETGLVCSSMAP